MSQNPATTETYEQGVEYALTRLTVRELQTFAGNLYRHEADTVTVAVQAMEEDGLVDSGWVHDYSAGEFDTAATPDLAGIVSVATLATGDDEAAFRTYHRIIGVEVD